MVSRHARVNLACAGYATAYFSGDFETATEMEDRAVELNPNSALAWSNRGWTYGHWRLVALADRVIE
jgi:adenylate cyclase